ncbi:class I mannose-6-phosphate isomerase [Promicromonospora vindobonensis]|uniref:Class I mannose-6-phosphate isomerase n=1 Tax=Promicromonospora vindobonensis TaxID=195748 RepID=A0ABW5VNM8_9MICO
MTYPSYRNYVREPVIKVAGTGPARSGTEVWAELDRAGRSRSDRPLIVVDCYPGVDLSDLRKVAERHLPDYQVIDVEDAAALPVAEIDAKIADNLTDDRVFGVLGRQTVDDFYDPDALRQVRDQVAGRTTPVVLVGWGALLVGADGGQPAGTGDAVVVLADMPRWEIQQRQRRGAPNWRCDNGAEDNLRKIKRGYFVEWRAADRHKKHRLFDAMDYLLDTTRLAEEAVLITRDSFQAGLTAAAAGPFRLVPFFDPGVWGGNWMSEVIGLPPSDTNYAWCFDGVPEEESLLLDVAGTIVEIPAIDLVLQRPVELLGERTYARFGAEFPIRFDFLDTMDGGNLSLQVHPLTDYIQETFGIPYTQDESYYLLDAEPDAKVYLGVRDDVEPADMMAALRRAEAGAEPFDAEKYINVFDVAKHDHVLIPAGTVHCSGRNSMVLEISATPYIFTFKMWDWGRLGLDGRPRPVHLDHAERNIQWDRRTDWVTQNLVDQVQRTGAGDGWVEERTGLHELEFIEVRRTWFTGPVEHDTAGTVLVLNLVEGAEAVIESPTGAFEPYLVHYAETFIVPASVGRFTVRPSEAAVGQELATLKAYVRGTERAPVGRPVHDTKEPGLS